MDLECKNCAHFKGDCGHHFVDWDNHIHFDIPSEAACDKYGQCNGYEPSEEYIRRTNTAKIQKIIDDVGIEIVYNYVSDAYRRYVEKRNEVKENG